MRIAAGILRSPARGWWRARATVVLLPVAAVLWGLLAWVSPVASQFAARPALRIDYLDASKPPRLRVFLSDLDGAGNPIVDRKRQSYRLLVDGLPQAPPVKLRSLAELGEPRALTLVVQVSPALLHVFTETIDAAKRLIEAMPAGSKVGLVAYTDVVVQDTRPTDPKQVKRELDDLRIRDDAVEVQLPDAIRDALEGLSNPRLPPVRAMVVLSDGLSSKIDFRIFAELGRRAKNKGVSVHTIGFNPPEPARLRTLYELSKRGGGTFRQAKTAVGISRAFAALEEELQATRVLSYELAQFFDGKLHDFQIELPEGQASNIVSGELAEFVPAEQQGGFGASSWLIFAALGGGLLALTLVTWLVIRRQSAGRSVAQRSEVAMRAYDDDEEEEEDYGASDERDDHDDADEDADEDDRGGADSYRRREDYHGRRAERPAPAAVIGASSARRTIDELFANDSASSGAAQRQDSSSFSRRAGGRGHAARAASVGASSSRRSDPYQATSAPERRTVQQRRGTPLMQRSPASPLAPPEPRDFSAASASDRVAPAGADFRLPMPGPRGGAAVERSPVADQGGSVQANGAISLAGLPDPDEYLQQAAAGGAPGSPVAPGVGPSREASVDRGQGRSVEGGKPLSPLVAGSGVPIEKVGLLPVGGETSRAQPGRFVDRKTSVMAVDDVQNIDFSAWIVAIDEPDYPTVAVHDGFTIGSDRGCDLQLQNEGILPKHGEVKLDSRGYRLETRGERGETLIRPLSDGETLSIGTREFLFKIASRYVERPLGAARLMVLDGMDQGRSLALQEGVAYTIGSHAGCALVVRGDQVGPRHAVALRKDRGCIVADLGAEGGLWHHEERIGQRVLRAGEEIRLGKIRLVYTIEDWSR